MTARRPRPAAPYLAARARFGVKFGLRTMRALMAALDHPERAFSALLVAGTNGKGSVVAYADAVLRASGLAVGRYTSPHLVRLHERIAVDGREVTTAELDRAVEAVRRAAEALVRRGRLADHPTHFEVLTAAAFHHFREKGVPVAVLEVGMGGRFDATNVCRPVASAIVTVDLDHQAYLGSTRAAIAREKAGVLRRGRVTVLGPLSPAARRAVAQEAARRGARLYHACADTRVRATSAGLRIETPHGVHGPLSPLPGAHQRDNLRVALRLLEAAREAGVPVDLGQVPEGIAATRWPGRLQWIDGEPPLLLDGAHNPAAARALADYLAGHQPFVLLFGAMADKDVAEVGRTLFPLARHLVLTRASGERAAGPEEIASRVGKAARRAHQEADPGRALLRARSLAPSGRPVVVAGSLYLVGDVLRRLRRG